MTVLASTPQEQLSLLIGTTIAQLDITDADFDTAERCYQDLGAHLSEASADVFVQGSFLLGTVVRPHTGDGEYDLDLVAKLNVAKTSISQKDLKERVGDLLASYQEAHDGQACLSPHDLTPGRRSWCLHYDGFHMDVLPCIPDTEAKSGTAIELTDTKLTHWQKSDPQAYVNWFRAQCAKEFLEKSIELSHTYGSVEDVPKHRVRTPLHRVVQILKRHRDIYFADDLDDRPPSSLITTLAAKSYRGERELVTATLLAVQRMPDHVEKRIGQYWVENPACEGENFADKWNDYPDRRLKFEAWRADVEQDLTGLLREDGGMTLIHSRLSEAFGAEPVTKAVKELGQRANSARQSGNVHFATGGLLTTTATATTTRVTDHRNFGDPTPR
jgi:hypothetical protein